MMKSVALVLFIWLLGATCCFAEPMCDTIKNPVRRLKCTKNLPKNTIKKSGHRSQKTTVLTPTSRRLPSETIQRKNSDQPHNLSKNEVKPKLNPQVDYVALLKKRKDELAQSQAKESDTVDMSSISQNVIDQPSSAQSTLRSRQQTKEKSDLKPSTKPLASPSSSLQSNESPDNPGLDNPDPESEDHLEHNTINPTIVSQGTVASVPGIGSITDDEDN